MSNKVDSSNTLLTICVGFIVVYVLLGYQWAIITSLTVGLIGVFSSYLSNIIAFLWMKLSLILSYIIPNILLSMVYFIVLFPVSVLYKIFNRNDILLLKNISNSTFKEKSEELQKNMFSKLW